MKKLAIASLVLFTAVACKQKTQNAQVLGAFRDSTEMAAFNQWKLQKSIDSAKAVDSAREAQMMAQAKAELRAEQAAAAPRTQTRTVYVREASQRSNAVAPSTQNNRQGWSKAAKGAVIGAAGGAVVGGVVTNKNKGVGAAVGAVAGAATGYTIGRAEDRKDGRVPPRQ